MFPPVTEQNRREMSGRELPGNDPVNWVFHDHKSDRQELINKDIVH